MESSEHTDWDMLMLLGDGGSLARPLGRGPPSSKSKDRDEVNFSGPLAHAASKLLDALLSFKRSLLDLEGFAGTSASNSSSYSSFTTLVATLGDGFAESDVGCGSTGFTMTISCGGTVVGVNTLSFATIFVFSVTFVDVWIDSGVDGTDDDGAGAVVAAATDSTATTPLLLP
jgi:hypothetical protein